MEELNEVTVHILTLKTVDFREIEPRPTLHVNVFHLASNFTRERFAFIILDGTRKLRRIEFYGKKEMLQLCLLTHKQLKIPKERFDLRGSSLGNSPWELIGKEG